MSRGNKLGPEPAIWKGALMGQIKWLLSFDDRQEVACGIIWILWRECFEFSSLKEKDCCFDVNKLSGRTNLL